MKAVIMAGGKGSRLRPLTCNIPKPMMLVMNQPLMYYTVELLKKHGISDIAVTLQYLPGAIREYFGEGEKLGVNISYFEEYAPLGTAGGVRNASDFLDETFVVISGDALTDFDLSAAFQFHQEKKGLCTIVLTHRDTPLEFGVCTMDEQYRITRYLEKPSWGEVFSDTVNTGIYILEPKIFDLYPKELFYDFSKDLFPLMLKKDIPLYGYTASGYWSDIGDLVQYRQTHMDILEGKIKVPLKGSRIAENVWVGQNTRIDAKAEVKGPVIVGDNCTVKAGVRLEEFTIIGEGNTLEQGASLKRSILWNHNYVGREAELRGTIISSQCIVKAKATMLEGSVISDHCSIGVNSTIRPEVKLWPKKVVADNSTISTSIVWSEGVGPQYFGLSGICGIPNVEITVDFITRLAAAFGSVLDMDAEICVSSDKNNYAQVLKRAFCSSLQSTGINTIDIGAANTSVNRYAVKVLSVNGGVHLRLVEEGDPRILIEFLDNFGINTDKNWERKIENTLLQEEFRRVNYSQVGDLKYLPQLADAYVDRLTRAVHRDKVHRKHYRIVLSYDYENLSSLLMPLLDKLGCQVIAVTQNRPIRSAYARGDRCKKPQKEFPQYYTPENLAASVKKSSADLGVIIDRNGEKMTLVTEQGEVVSEDLKTALLVMVSLCSSEKFSEGKRAAVPVSAPNVIEILAEKFHGQAVRTKVSPRAVMEVTRDSYFQLHFDALYGLVLILDYMAAQDMKLSQLVKEIPKFCMKKDTVSTSWQDIGKIMRRLMEDSKSQEVERIDGIKIFCSQGWTLIIPGVDEPLFYVISESSTLEEAEKLTAFYINKIREMHS
ncbi:sugar phosphate nucleotidyltransferase [Candidatus Contubernalis alkaliaceticus]|uniref:sugar phosphate nucleotidyltransferase n=1 Tax=Candidatus Contubernalis alkaliaceticus TaxID=338645 RepID=UPI001F4C4890|nr:sugar phosphate nucleotidyltransferase [Candidatus Contubernalis alkalaceticus]UNC93424.1 NTP transferase domain-containing protein [Candidatus Contubernalis alkalaceticus]